MPRDLFQPPRKEPRIPADSWLWDVALVLALAWDVFWIVVFYVGFPAMLAWWLWKHIF